MSATLVGTTGTWGIASDETGLIIETLDFDQKLGGEKAVKNKTGDTIGLSMYDKQYDVAMKGLATSAGGFSGTIAGTLTVSNTAPAGYAGASVIKSIKKSLNIEDFVRFEIGGTVYGYGT